MITRPTSQRITTVGRYGRRLLTRLAVADGTLRRDQSSQPQRFALRSRWQPSRKPYLADRFAQGAHELRQDETSQPEDSQHPREHHQQCLAGSEIHNHTLQSVVEETCPTGLMSQQFDQ